MNSRYIKLYKPNGDVEIYKNIGYIRTNDSCYLYFTYTPEPWIGDPNPKRLMVNTTLPYLIVTEDE